MKQMTLEDVHKVLYDILVDIHDFCVKNDIKYSLSGGSLLGAVRHNGIIPWDDDIDIQMSRPEYERFIHSYKSNKGYELFCRELSGCEDVTVAFSRVCEMRKTVVNTGEFPWRDHPTGLWVDVLPIDGAPKSAIIAKIKIKVMYVFWILTIMSRHASQAKIRTTRGLMKKVRMVIKKGLVAFLPKDFVRRYIDMCQQYKYENSNYIANYSTMQYKFREWQPKSSMNSLVLHKFEKGEFYIMEDYDVSLSHLYGNYMELPPVEKRVAHIENSYFWK